MGICCVEGCKGKRKGTVYFEFPTSRGLRRKWLDVLNIGTKVPIGTVVCSQHFHQEEYEIVRGKVRLKRKVVPTLLLQIKSHEIQPREETSLDKKENSVLPDKKIVENPDPPKPDSTTDNSVEVTNIASGETVEESKIESKKESGEATEICKVVNKNGAVTSRKSVERDLVQPDPKQPPDFEEMITNYQIKNSKPHSLLPQETEKPQESERDGAIVVDDKGDAPPVFIEISVDKGNNTTNTGNEDCLMVLESVQVDVDPNSLMLPEREEDEEIERDFQEDVKPPDKKDDPISLLTSSDEDDVIIQEPHIDTVEVSDETDEDDMPLVKLVKKQPSKKKSTKKKTTPESLNNFVWNGVYDFYCIQCHFTTTNSVEYNTHIQEHHRVLQVCSVCSYTTTSKTLFKRHLRKHRDDKQFKCHLCDYRARHNVSLIYHIQSHEADKHYVQNVKRGYKCLKCGCFRSALQAAVLNHVRTCGTNGKSFPCDVCDYVSKRKSDLKRHWMSRHQDSIVDVDSDSSYKSDHN